tara:strand:- start:7 stop:186 length:180 start_codon:yes stop_codon:yes gene_type:complete
MPVTDDTLMIDPPELPLIYGIEYRLILMMLIRFTDILFAQISCVASTTFPLPDPPPTLL